MGNEANNHFPIQSLDSCLWPPSHGRDVQTFYKTKGGTFMLNMDCGTHLWCPNFYFVKSWDISSKWKLSKYWMWKSFYDASVSKNLPIICTRNDTDCNNMQLWLFLIVRKIKQNIKSDFLFYNIWIALIGGWLSHCRTFQFPNIRQAGEM